VEVVAVQVDGGQFLVGDFDALGIVALVELGVDAQPGVGRRCGDRVDDDLVADQWPAAPVLGDEAP
jgi:hypothetical protein